ncbi:MAG: hypothetical protein ABIJ09_22930 [Pseudomonadota bacterium]
MSDLITIMHLQELTRGSHGCAGEQHEEQGPDEATANQRGSR